MSVMQSLRAKRSRTFALRFRDSIERQEFPSEEFDIERLMKPKWVLDSRNGLITSEIGFVVMTVLPSKVQYRDGMTLVPGCDHVGNQGYLIFRPNRLPFHSLASTARDACAEVLAAHRRSDSLVDQFGGKEELKMAVRATPWHQWCNIGDAYNAGLCEWGVRSFLGRFKLRRVGLSIGIPHGVLRFAGSYGERITAASIVRTGSCSERVVGKEPLKHLTKLEA